jgi:hypothetical protein
MWLAKVRQEEYDKKEARLGVIDKRQRSETSVRVREREYRKARCATVTAVAAAASVSVYMSCIPSPYGRRWCERRAAAMLVESKARVARQEEEEKARFVARQARSTARTKSAERHRVSVIKERSAELATKKVLQAEVREKASKLYDERLQSFAEHVRP